MPSPEIFHQGRLGGDRFFVRERTQKRRYHAGPLSVIFEHHQSSFDHRSHHNTRVAVGHHVADIHVPGAETVINAAKNVVLFARNHKPRI